MFDIIVYTAQHLSSHTSATIILVLEMVASSHERDAYHWWILSLPRDWKDCGSYIIVFPLRNAIYLECNMVVIIQNVQSGGFEVV